MSDSRERVLFVCTANICRSPAAELLARSRFGEGGLVFRSAGFLRSGRECAEKMVKVLATEGIDGSDHRSYQVDVASAQAADIVLTMESSHVQQLTTMAPAEFPKILPLAEAASLLEGFPSHHVPIGQLLAELERGRDPLSYLDDRWDVADPYGGRTKGYRKAVSEIDDLVTRVIGRIQPIAH